MTVFLQTFNQKNGQYANERPCDCSIKFGMFFTKETQDHIKNPNWNVQQIHAASKRKSPRTKLGSGGKRSFAKKIVSFLLRIKNLLL